METVQKKRMGQMSIKHFLSEYGIVLALIAIVAILAIMSPAFLTSQNIINLLRQVSINAILAIGLTFVILTAGIDLSVGSILAFSGIVAASFATGPDGSVFVSIIVGLACGALFGLLNGTLVAKAKVAPFIATLGTMAIARGATFIFNDGQPISNLSEGFLNLGRGSIFGLPIPVVIVAVVTIIFSIVLYQTKFGRHVFAVGGNPIAAKISGINVDRLLILVYCISGMLAGLAGVIMASRVSAGLPQAGVSYELDAIAAVVIGGTSLMGGKGRLWGTLVGALIIGVVNNGLDLLGVSSYWQQVVKGCIIVIAVMLDRKRS